MKRILYLILSLPLCLVSLAQAEKDNCNKWRFGLSGGMTYDYGSAKELRDLLMTTGVDRQAADKYINDLRWGKQVNIDAHYMTSQKWGFGLRYIFVGTSSELKDAHFGSFDGQHHIVDDIETRAYMNYVGPSVARRTFINKKQTLALESTISLGYANTRSESEGAVSVSSLETGHCLGLFYDLGAEYFVSKQVSVGAGITFMSISILKAKYEDSNGNAFDIDLSNTQRSNSNIGFSLGVRFYL